MASEQAVARVMDLLAEAGRQSYGGEPVSQLEHALQAAHLAESQGLDEEVVVASLLHDLGHLTPEARVALGDAAGEEPPDPADQEERARREAAGHGDAGAAFLGDAGSARLRWLIANHAAAKRYLCAIDASYNERLSSVSRQTLAHQGGPMSLVECAEMERHPWREELIALRRFDDEAKVPGQPTPDLAHYRPMLERQLQPDPTAS